MTLTGNLRIAVSQDISLNLLYKNLSEKEIRSLFTLYTVKFLDTILLPYS